MSAAKILKRYALITVACGLYALGFNWFFVPNRFTVGGFTGIAQIINHFLPMLPVGIVALVLNIPLFILGWRKIGRDLLISSLYATAVSSLMIDVLASIHTFSPMDPARSIEEASAFHTASASDCGESSVYGRAAPVMCPRA